jgi:hypothetical protein
MNSYLPKRVKGLLLVGGASRNVGKTTFISSLIRNFSKSHKIVGIKVKTIYDNDLFFHGNDIGSIKENFILIEEFDLDNEKDSAGMLKAGAKRAFRLKVHHSQLLIAFNYFIDLLGEETLIVCESNSIRRVIIPDLFLFIKFPDNLNIKPSGIELEKKANRVIYTDGLIHHFNLNEIEIKDSEWVLNN